MRITIDLLGWTLTWAAEQGAIDHGERGEATSYPVAPVDQSGEPYDARARFGFRRDA